MTKKTIRDHIKSPLGMTLLGAGIWQFIVYPILKYIINIGFDGSKSIADSVSNYIYRTAATGDKQSASMVVLEFVIYFIFWGSLWLILEIVQRKEKSKQRGKEMAEKVNDLIDQLNGKTEDRPSREKQLEELLELKAQVMAGLNYIRLDWLTRILTITIIIFISFTAFKYIVILKSNQICTDFNQLIQASSPYLTESQRVMLNSRFARMKDKETFQKIQLDISKILNGENVIMPNDPLKLPISPSQPIK
jgi:hypothetical protein